MNRFYTFPKWLQWTAAVLLTTIAFGMMGWWMFLNTVHPVYYLLIFFLIPVFQFTMSPLFRLLGTYHYLSPMLLVYAPSEKKYDLHNGTSFDYLFVMRSVPPGHIFQQIMLNYYIEGLLNLIRLLENGDLPPTIEITGTSYFFSDTTAKRLGFSLEPPSSFYRVNLYLNFLDLLWMYSLAKGKLVMPRLNNIRAAKTTGEFLLQKKSYLERLQSRLYPISKVLPANQ